MPVTTEVISHAGWDRNLQLTNGACELIASLDVGPRVLSFRTSGGKNIFKNISGDMGKSGEDTFKLRGGHRLWTAPEDMEITYHVDNHAVKHLPLHDGSASLISQQTKPISIEKNLTLRLDEILPKVTVGHTIKNTGAKPLSLATWALTILEPGGVEIIPQPPLEEHPGNLLPERNLVIWPYTDITDERYSITSRYILLRQMENKPPTKIGLRHISQWVAYVRENALFIKSIELQPDREYTDRGCNFETFTNSDFIEIESLGPLTLLHPGESASHSETWHIFDLDKPVEIRSEEALTEWLRPFLVQAGFND